MRRQNPPFDGREGIDEGPDDWHGLSYETLARLGLCVIRVACGVWLVLFIVAACN